MINSAILEVVVGLIFVYWLLALICSMVNEVIVGLFGLRARELQNGIRTLLQGGTLPPEQAAQIQFVTAVLNSQFIRGLTNKPVVQIKGLMATGPSYIPAHTFASAVLDTLFTAQAAAPSLTQQAHALLATSDMPDGLRPLTNAADQALSTLDQHLQVLRADTTLDAQTKHALDQLTRLFPAESATQVLSQTLSQQTCALLTQPAIPDGLRTLLKVSTNQAKAGLEQELQRLLADPAVKDQAKQVLTVMLTQPTPVAAEQARALLSDLALPDNVRNLLMNYLNQTDATLKQCRANLEQWFNDAMDRVSGWYKRKTQIIIAILAALMCVVFNIDTLAVADHLYRAPADRAALLALTDDIVKSSATSGAPTDARMTEVLDITDKASVAQIGWPSGVNIMQLPPGAMMSKVLGWVLSVIAALFGAPFWFDLLRNTLNLRSAGQKPTGQSKS